MLKKNIYELDKNIFDMIGNKCPILTAGDRFTGFNSMTVSWGGLGVLWGKNVAFVFVRKSRYTYQFIEKSNSITLSFLPEKYNEAKTIFGKFSGKDINKYEKSNLHTTFDIDYNGYYITESEFVLKMKKLYSIDIPYEKLPDSIKQSYYSNGDEHTMYVCEISQYLVNEE
ncbi:MAG: flavin reductase [Anaeroplasma sp.]